MNTQHSQESSNFPPSFFRVSIKALIVKHGKVLLLDEGPKETGGRFELPGGGLDFGENIHEALKREIFEETGLVVKSVAKNPTYIWTWRFEQTRNMDWFYSLVIAYKVELESFEGHEKLSFFSKEDLQTADLRYQTNGLKEYFNPEDFTL